MMDLANHAIQASGSMEKSANKRQLGRETAVQSITMKMGHV